MSEIHYFPRYKQQENFVTNNTLLLLLRLYEFDRFKFGKFMEGLCAEQDIEPPTFSLQFGQQRPTGKSVPDGFVAQESVKIVVETKRDDRFNITQLKNHLEAFRREQHKFLVLLSPTPAHTPKEQLDAIRDEASPQGIEILHTSFADIVQHARNCLSDHDDGMRDLVTDYEAFCSHEDLLPNDTHTLFVPPCSKSFKENREFRLYYCPAARSHRKARYLGIYAKRKVLAIGSISNVVSCDVDLGRNKLAVHEASRNPTEREKKRILGATIKAQKHGWDVRIGRKFYLCDVMVDTDFRKRTPGGIWGHRYLDLREVLGEEAPADIGELATLLGQHTWE